MYRVIGVQETGEETIVAPAVDTWKEAARIADRAYDDHPEWRDAYVEEHPYTQAMRYGW